MFSSKVTILAILAVAAYLSVSIHGAEALMCYTCNSTMPSCNKTPVNVKDLGMETCATSTEKCATVQFHSPTNWTNILTWRGCSGSNQTCDTLNATWTHLNQGLTWCSLCDKNHCNSASTFAAPLVAMLVSFLAVKFLQ